MKQYIIPTTREDLVWALKNSPTNVRLPHLLCVNEHTTFSDHALVERIDATTEIQKINVVAGHNLTGKFRPSFNEALHFVVIKTDNRIYVEVVPDTIMSKAQVHYLKDVVADALSPNIEDWAMTEVDATDKLLSCESSLPNGPRSPYMMSKHKVVLDVAKYALLNPNKVVWLKKGAVLWRIRRQGEYIAAECGGPDEDNPSKAIWHTKIVCRNPFSGLFLNTTAEDDPFYV